MPDLNRVTEDDLELVDPTTLQPHPDNPRVHDDAVIQSSMKDHGIIDVCVVQREGRRLLSGHGRWENALTLGADTVPVLWVDCDDAEAEEIMLVLNRAADRASYDSRGLAAILARVRDSGREVSRTGWSDDDLAQFVARITKRDEPPSEFPDVTGISTEYRCPRCSYEWSGSARPPTGDDEAAV
jgi:ParB-like chromosome segregation protein Spo0J